MRQCDISRKFLSYVSYDWRLRHVRCPHDEERPSDLRLRHAGSLFGVWLQHSLHEAVPGLEGNIVQVREPEVRGREGNKYFFISEKNHLLCRTFLWFFVTCFASHYCNFTWRNETKHLFWFRHGHSSTRSHQIAGDRMTLPRVSLCPVTSSSSSSSDFFSSSFLFTVGTAKASITPNTMPMEPTT